MIFALHFLPGWYTVDAGLDEINFKSASPYAELGKKYLFFVLMISTQYFFILRRVKKNNRLDQIFVYKPGGNLVWLILEQFLFMKAKKWAS